MKGKIAGLLMAGVMMCSAITSASAATAPTETKPAPESPSISVGTSQSVGSKAEKAEKNTALAYPTNIQYPSDRNGVILKSFKVATADMIEDLDRSDITYQGVIYHFQDITVVEEPYHDEKNYIETLTGESQTKNKDDILAMLDLRREVTTEDGYTGILDLDATSLTTDVTAYGHSTKTKTVSKSYTGLSDADLTFIPKSVTENGVTCSLVDVKWTETSPYNPYDPDYGTRFNATAVYKGNYSSSYAKGYSYEVKYYGTVTKDEITGYECTLMFVPQVEEHWYDVFVGENSNPVAVFAAIAVLCLLVACAGYTIWTLAHRRGQEVTTTEEVIEDDDNTGDTQQLK